MKPDIELVFVAMVILLFLDAVLAIRLIIFKLKRDDKDSIDAKLKARLIAKWVKKGDIKNINSYFGILADSKNLVKLESEMENQLPARLEKSAIIKKSFRRLKSHIKLRRIHAAINLSLLATDEAVSAITEALVKEKEIQVKLYFANALSDIGSSRSIPVLVSSLLGENRWYREKVNMLIADFGSEAYEYIYSIMDRDEIEILDLIVDMASIYPSEKLKKYVFQLLDNYESNRVRLIDEADIESKIKNCDKCIYKSGAEIVGSKKCRYGKETEREKGCAKRKSKLDNKSILWIFDSVIEKAADAASKYYFKEFAFDKYLLSSNTAIRKRAVAAMAKIQSLSSINKLKEMLYDREIARSAQLAISEIIEEKPEFLDEVSDMLISEKNEEVTLYIAESLSVKIEYFIMKLMTEEREQAERIIEEILLLGKTSEFIGFLNNNKDKSIESALIAILKKVLAQKEELKEEFSTYLHEPLLKEVGLNIVDEESARKGFKRRAGLITTLSVELMLLLAIFPAIYIARHFDAIGVWSWIKHLKIYVVDYNYFLAFYSVAINVIYLILIAFSRINVSRQAKAWQLKNDKMLFKSKMLPGISIIAPAYNEESIIVESVHSLLNLKYPDYNLIIVNDGSADNTLGVLIEYFSLERFDYAYESELKTAPVMGIYRNPAYPKLLVVDKENAGKADSLNAGIMISNKEYFCCIDSDSLLENDALLKLASQTLDEDVETPALGGNVFPVNGCKVSKGHIGEKRIPENIIARFQTIEYIRAFMSGRLGWAYLDSLLIISGAFGVFRKERVINVGGYLTKSSIYNKDTVGEDMELVVRISRMMHEQKKKFKINYCYNANCWTEVPEKIKQLRKQRFRWYRGLSETLHFHAKTIFNPRYKRMGLIGMPYFFLFEMIGPLIEAQGYLMVLAAFILGILSIEIALFLFVASVMLGVLVSIISLIIAETENRYYSYKDIIRLLGIAIVENFGPRQLFSFWRVAGFFNMFSKEHVWGEQKRKGFAKNKQGGRAS